MKCAVISLCFFVISLSCISAKNLPSFIKKCKLDYPQVNECLNRTVMEMKPYLAKGIPAMKIPAFDPMSIPKVELHTGNGTSAEFSGAFVDIVITGANNFQASEVDFNLKEGKSILHIFIPTLHLRSTYNVNGKILVLELSSKGHMEVNLTGVTSRSETSMKVVTKNGKEYIEIGDEPAVINFGKISMHLDNLFKGNEELTEHTNKIINENIDELQKEIKPLIDSTIDTFVNGIVRRVFDDFSMDELFD